MNNRLRHRASVPLLVAAVAVLAASFAALVACTTTETITVEVPVTTAPEVVVQTVVVENVVEVQGETVVQTVVVEREVEVRGETVVQTVVVEKEVQGETVGGNEATCLVSFVQSGI